MLMRTWCSPPAAAAAGLVFLLAPPTVAVTCWIATRHYVEGMIPFTAGALVIRSYLRESHRWKLAVAGLCYFLACAFKEIYALLPVAVLVLPGATRRQRLEMLGALGLAAAAYVSWRVTVSGGLITRYGNTGQSPWSMLSYLARAWPQFSGWMLTSPAITPFPAAALMCALSVATLYVLARESLAAALAYLLCLAAAVIPSAFVIGTEAVRFVDVANHYCLRFVFLPAVLILMGGVLALDRLGPGARNASLAALLLLVAYNGYRQVRPWWIDGRVTKQAADVYRQWFDRNVVFASDVPVWLHDGLLRLWTPQGSPEIPARARVIPAAPGSIARNDPALRQPDVRFVEALRSGVTMLDRETFLHRYARPSS
jgi:hypothetical protein